ncbi:uncharacterized protein GGQ84_002656 [Desulfitispora alkaliphila]|uniref:ATP-dependent sacrificial sulfur transferase LarE n=1 Tax=Desulfitispora alkaliphila TaxID=622674 RepID=UPI003D1CCA55
MDLEQKYSKLKEILTEMETVVVAYSGGVDSTFLLKVAADVLGENVLGVTSASETISNRELADAENFIKLIGASHEIIYTDELNDHSFNSNPVNRCYYCKKELFSKLLEIAKARGFKYVVDGANHDDRGDFRPGITAGRELGVRSPLQEASLTKDDIRILSKRLGLPTWNKPAKACLSSRFPYGEQITPTKITQVEEAENFLDDLGFSQFRVRHHGPLARIELLSEEIALAMDINNREKIIAKLKDLGFSYVTIDMQGFRSGSMNEVISANSEASTDE